MVAVHRDADKRTDGVTPESTDQPRQPAFRVGNAAIDTASRQILFNGIPADVQPKVFDLIVYLIENRDRAVTKDELFDEIWPSVVVSEASLTQLIKRARNLFRQHGFEQEVIRTVARTGYQFDHAVEIVSGEAGAITPIRANKLPASALYLTVAALLLSGMVLWFFNNAENPTVPTADPILANSNSIAVLPFSNLTPDPDFDYFSDGLTETVTNSLTQVAGLRVIASGSAFSFREPEVEFTAVAERLRVGHIVQGSVQRDDTELRISARLVRLADGTQVWSQIYNRELDDIFALHDDISRAILEQMAVMLPSTLNLPRQADLITANSNDSEAYRLLLRGQVLSRNGSSAELENAEALFRRAIELKPDYADALVALASTIRIRAVIGQLPRESSFSEALVLARQALAIDPQHIEALVQIGEIQHRHFWEFEDAADSFRQALEINPGNASVHSAFSRFLSKYGRQQEAVQQARIAVNLNPLSTSAHSSLVIRLIWADELDAARIALDTFKRDYPEHFDIPWLETNWHIRNESYGDALQWIALEEYEYLRLSLSAVILNYLGRTAQAQQALDELIETDGEGATFQIAEVYAHWGQPDMAFQWLDQACEQGDPGLAELYSSVNLGNLYNAPRFAELARKIGLSAPPSSF